MLSTGSCDVLEPYRLAAKRQFISNEPILLEEPLYEIPKRFGGLIRTVEDPFLHPHEIFQLHPIPLHAQQVDVLLLSETERHQGEIDKVQKITQTLPISSGGQRQWAAPIWMKRFFGGLEIDRRHHGDELSDLPGFERRIAKAHRASLAYAQQIGGINCMLFQDEFDAMPQVSMNVFV